MRLESPFSTVFSTVGYVRDYFRPLRLGIYLKRGNLRTLFQRVLAIACSSRSLYSNAQTRAFFVFRVVETGRLLMNSLL